jgi:CDP-glucose 4,6-dehydratase
VGGGQRAVEGLGLTAQREAFWRGVRVLVTGHTGFKGAWLTLWLQRLGADVAGYALAPPAGPNAFSLARLDELSVSEFADVGDRARLRAAFQRHRPQFVFHLAAQALVRAGYADPAGTYETNALGTANVLLAARAQNGVRAVVVVTSDKCYDGRDGERRHREEDALGGDDPYSASKACAEHVTAALRATWAGERPQAPLFIATARAGNVIGGGDWSPDRLVPDALTAFSNGATLSVRNPSAIRPWQYVLDPVSAYLDLAEKLAGDDAGAFARAWNFGPPEEAERTVAWVADRLAAAWGPDAAWQALAGDHPPERHVLRLDSTAAKTALGWRTRVELERALELTARWYRSYAHGQPVRALMLDEIARYQKVLAA